jgi:hypothetical protein
MTTTTTTELRLPTPSRMRRNGIAALAGAALVASATFAVSRVTDDDPPRLSVQPANELTVDLTAMHGAFWAAAPPESTIDATTMHGAFWAAAPPEPTLDASVMNGAFG